MERILRLIALLALASPGAASAQVPLLTFTYHVEGCEPASGLLLQPVSVCGHVFQTTPGAPDLLQRFVVNVTLGSPVDALRFGVALQGVNLGFDASGDAGNRFELHLATSTLLGCQRTGSLSFVNPAQLSGSPRLHGIVATQGSTFGPADPFYIEGPFVSEVAPGSGRTFAFELDQCLPGQFDLHVEGLHRLSSLLGSFGDPPVLATLTGLPPTLDVLYRDLPQELLVDLRHDAANLAGVFALPDAGDLVIARAPREIVARATRDGAGDLTGIAVALANTPAGGAHIEYDGSLLGEVSGILVDRITSAGVEADLVLRRFAMGDPAFSGGSATFDRRQGVLAVASGGPGASHAIDFDVTALSVFRVAVDASDGVSLTLDHDGILEAVAELPHVGSFTIRKLRSAGLFVDPEIPAFVLEDSGRSGGFARFRDRDGTLLADLATADGLRARVDGVAMEEIRALVDVEDEIALLVDHVGKIDVDVESPSIGRFEITRLPAHLAAQAERDLQGDLSRLRVETSGGTLQTRVNAATTVVGSALTASLGALLAGVLELDRATDLVSLDVGYALGAGDLFLDLAGSTDGQAFLATASGHSLSSLSLLMSLDTEEEIELTLDHVGWIDLDLDFPGLTRVEAIRFPQHAAFEARRDANGDLAVVDVALAQGAGGSRVEAWADLDDVDFYARFDDIGSGNILADLAANRVDVDLRFATPNGFVDVDGQGQFSGRNVRFSLNSVDLNRARLLLADDPISLGANGSRAGSHLTLDVGLDFIGIPLSFDAKVRRRSDARYDLEFPLQLPEPFGTPTETVSVGTCKKKGIPQLVSQIDLELCALNP